MARRIRITPTRTAQTRPPRRVIREFQDRGWRWIFSDIVLLHCFLHLVDPDTATRVDPTRAEPLERSFLPDDLRQAESDVVWRIPYRIGDADAGRCIWIIILLEHQTWPDVEIALRLLFYMACLWVQEKTEFNRDGVPADERRYSFIMPIVFHTGEDEWTEPLNLAALIEAPGGMEPCIPAWKTFFVPLRRQTDQELAQAGPLAPVLRAQRDIGVSREAFPELLTEALAELNELPETMRYQWLELVHFLRLLVHHRRGVRERPDLERRVVEATERSKFRRVARGEMVLAEKTYAEVLREEGEARGEARGEMRGMEHEARTFLLRILGARFGEVSEALRARVEEATADWCHQVGEQAVRVNSLSELRWT